jgi:hypothetical protein
VREKSSFEKNPIGNKKRANRVHRLDSWISDMRERGSQWLREQNLKSAEIESRMAHFKQEQYGRMPQPPFRPMGML